MLPRAWVARGNTTIHNKVRTYSCTHWETWVHHHPATLGRGPVLLTCRAMGSLWWSYIYLYTIRTSHDIQNIPASLQAKMQQHVPTEAAALASFGHGHGPRNKTNQEYPKTPRTRLARPPAHDQQHPSRLCQEADGHWACL